MTIARTSGPPNRAPSKGLGRSRGDRAGAAAATRVWDDRALAYDFGAGHPFRMVHRRLAAGLLDAEAEARGLELARIDSVPPASRADLERFHEPEYLDRVAAESGSPRPAFLDAGDTPAFPGCFEAAARIAGGALAAWRSLSDGGPPRAIHPAGGLHHARPGGASGFCIFNDVGIALAEALDGPSAVPRAAYIDLDAHHGDGVMYGFYGDGRLLDIDFHQDGRTLFPGTGHVEEVGTGDGAGRKVNLPMPPGAGDAEFIWLFDRVVPPLLAEHRPGLLVVQHGMDGHDADPLAQLRLGPESYGHALRSIRDWAGENRVPLLVTGGGGYRAASVARGLARAGLLLLEADPAADDPLPPEWRESFREATGQDAPTSWDGPKKARAPEAPWAHRLLQALGSAMGREFRG